MPFQLNRLAVWILAWALVGAIGAVLLARAELGQLRDAFDTDARIVHRLLSQRVVQHDAVLASLALLQPPAGPEPRLASVYPQILEVKRREGSAQWSDPALVQAEARSRAQKRPELASMDLAAGRYVVVNAADPASFALRIDLRQVVPWAEWPMDPETSAVRVSLVHLGQQVTIQKGQAGTGGWRFEFQKHLAAESQPFNVLVERQVGWPELPWLRMLAWLALVAATLAAMRALLRQQEQRRRAEQLLRLGQVARLNQMGELAAGLAHELNQPLTAVLANTQAAQRLLAEDPPELETARGAMAQAATQARRASDVIARLRRSIDPSTTAPLQAVNLAEVAAAALHLLAPQLQSHHVIASVSSAEPVIVKADPVAVEQIIHNLITNAIEAMQPTPAADRRLTLAVAPEGAKGVLSVCDTGPGIPAEALPRLFEPFFSTRSGGLGLGLSLCESLAARMGGQLTAGNQTQNDAPTGAIFTLSLPLQSHPS
jgi:signal transduction histidine kinase